MPPMARQRKRTQLEDCLKIVVNRLRLQAISQGETTQWIIRWDPSYSSNPRTMGLLTCRLASATRGSVRLLLRSLDQSINLVALPRHFGGHQWYFLCPLTGRRASVLWMPPTKVVSRHAKRGEANSRTPRNSKREFIVLICRLTKFTAD